jgi:ATP-dependent helicase HrpA
MRPEDLIRGAGPDAGASAFPDALEVGSTQLPIGYRFQPGAEDDGVTVTVPTAALPQISDERLGWLVPGLLQEKVIALIKALPKRIRRNLVPAADTAARVVETLEPQYGQVPFMQALCAALAREAEMPIHESDFSADKLPEHLQFRVRVVDDHGESLASGRSVRELRAQLQLDDTAAEQEVGGESGGGGDEELARDGLTDFDLEELPVEVTRQRGGVRVAQYPALVDRGESVSVRVLPERGAAEIATRQGLMRLFALAERKEIRSQIRWLPERERCRVLMAHAVPAEQFDDRLADLLARRAFVDGEPTVRTAAEFARRREQRARRIAVATQEIAAWLPQLAEAIHEARGALESLGGQASREIRADVSTQIERLLSEGFLRTTPWRWLQHYPRYFEAIAYRIDKWRCGNAAKDRQLNEQIERIWQDYQRQSDAEQADREILQEVRWMVEELRVSFFAQPLGTAVKVSPQRIEKQLKAVKQGVH